MQGYVTNLLTAPPGSLTCLAHSIDPWIFVYFRLFNVVSDFPRKRLVVKGLVQGYMTNLLTAPLGSFTCSAHSIATRELRIQYRPKDISNC